MLIRPQQDRPSVLGVDQARTFAMTHHAPAAPPCCPPGFPRETGLAPTADGRTFCCAADFDLGPPTPTSTPDDDTKTMAPRAGSDHGRDEDDEASQLARADQNATAHEAWLAGDKSLADEPDAVDDVVSAQEASTTRSTTPRVGDSGAKMAAVALALVTALAMSPNSYGWIVLFGALAAMLFDTSGSVPNAVVAFRSARRPIAGSVHNARRRSWRYGALAAMLVDTSGSVPNTVVAFRSARRPIAGSVHGARRRSGLRPFVSRKLYRQLEEVGRDGVALHYTGQRDVRRETPPLASGSEHSSSVWAKTWELIRDGRVYVFTRVEARAQPIASSPIGPHENS